jgi:hypothetical protein
MLWEARSASSVRGIMEYATSLDSLRTRHIDTIPLRQQDSYFSKVYLPQHKDELGKVHAKHLFVHAEKKFSAYKNRKPIMPNYGISPTFC